jgi:chromosomal replication initiation ATPase DnaA
MPSQLTLSWEMSPALGRGDFIVSLGNREAVAFIDSWPRWHGPAAIHGPAGAGKSHLAAAWAAASHATVLTASALNLETVSGLGASEAIAVEDIDSALPSDIRDRALFALFERGAPFLLTGREPAAAWPTVLPDLASRFAAVLAFPIWAPDDALLASLARKLFADRQLQVSDAVISRIVVSLERSPAAIRDLIARADARALAEKRAVTTALIGELLDAD